MDTGGGVGACAWRKGAKATKASGKRASESLGSLAVIQCIYLTCQTGLGSDTCFDPATHTK